MAIEIVIFPMKHTVIYVISHSLGYVWYVYLAG